jgi:hypothetical protein
VSVDTEGEESLTAKADAAFKQAALEVIERSRRFGTPIIIWREGRVQALPQAEIDELEARLKAELRHAADFAAGDKDSPAVDHNRSI